MSLDGINRRLGLRGVGATGLRHVGTTAAALPAEDKIAAIGIRLRKWVSFHGISINVEPDLEHFSGIVPCGISDHGVTSLVDLGLPVGMGDLDVALHQSFARAFPAPRPAMCLPDA